jgi:hypothetical protein
MDYEGKCLCGAVIAEIIDDPKWVTHCHCPSCRKSTGAAFSTYAGFDAAAVKFSGDALKKHKSSPGVSRTFCNICGSSIAFEGEAWPGEIHLHAGFIKQADQLEPQAHSYISTKLAWLHLGEDDLPRNKKFSDK